MIDQKLLAEIQVYVQYHLRELTDEAFELCHHLEALPSFEKVYSNELEDFIEINRKPTLNQVLFGFIDQKERSDAEVYKRAGMDRRHFSKIRSNPHYQPRKSTILSLALALELSKEDTDKLLSSAGYSLSESDVGDLIVQYFLEKNIYDIHLVNQALDNFDLKPLNGDAGTKVL